MVEAAEPQGVGGLALGTALGAVLWNLLFLGAAALGVLSGAWAWTCIQTVLWMAGGCCLALFALGGRW